MAITLQGRGLGETLQTVRQMPTRLARTRTRAINRTAREGKKFTAQKVFESVNLKKSDINKRLKVEKATRSRPEAKLTAGFRPRLLSRFGARARTQRVKHPERSQGFPRFGIPPGRKFAGVSVKVKRGGSRARLPGGFLLELKTSGAVGLAVRTGRGPQAYKVLHGPSVHQVVGWHEEAIEAFIREDLARTFDEEWAKELEQIR
ncbi:conserved hypothetical protein [Nitrosococcus halophilus Nc 4]|uniref:Uncharacterized protein n=1 Tax=Nitrosococcus halophilus (strain Nc4) TaxID=472759 RepID=D5BYW2_NITHN|nr:phage tail protein [Nitrosococcus halophilus]ADE14175.1 conserved hypothetical protein [Nitrosococcus halophilus Nc 4]